MDKNVEKQLIVRTFEPDMAVLKQVAKQMSGMQDVALNLFGQAGEVLIVITARAHAPAAASLPSALPSALKWPWATRHTAAARAAWPILPRAS